MSAGASPAGWPPHGCSRCRAPPSSGPGRRPCPGRSAGTPGVVVILVLLAVTTGYIYLRSRATRVDHKSVNAEWTGPAGPGGVAVAASARAGLTGPVT
jgi:hypothetical protein